MKRISLAYLGLFLFLSACASAPVAQERNLSSENPVWKESGKIEVTNIDGSLIVVRADPLITPLSLINSPAGSADNVATIAANEYLDVVINAAMFGTDYVTSIGYMRNYENVNNPRFSAKLRGFLLFNPKDPKSPAVKIGGKEDIGAYHTAFQTYRMWDADKGILWNKGASIYHHVGLVGVDDKSRILFFYHSRLVDVHDLVEKILSLKLNLTGLLYLDGGNHAALFLSPELGQEHATWLVLPNLLGIKGARP